MTDPLAALRLRFRARVGEDLARLRVLVSGDLHAIELRRLIHNIAGSAGTFGYPELSTRALWIDDRYAAGEAPKLADLAALEAALAEVAAS